MEIIKNQMVSRYAGTPVRRLTIFDFVEFLLARHNPGLGQPLLKGLQTFVILTFQINPK